MVDTLKTELAASLLIERTRVFLRAVGKLNQQQAMKGLLVCPEAELEAVREALRELDEVKHG